MQPNKNSQLNGFAFFWKRSIQLVRKRANEISGGWEMINGGHAIHEEEQWFGKTPLNWISAYIPQFMEQKNS